MLEGEGVWGAVDTSPDLGGQNVLKTIEMAIRHNRRPTRRELEFSVAGFILIYVRKYFSDPLTGGARPHRGSATDEHCIGVRVNKIENFFLKSVLSGKSATQHLSDKKLRYRRGTARCVVSIEILPITTQQCRNYLYKS